MNAVGCAVKLGQRPILVAALLTWGVLGCAPSRDAGPPRSETALKARVAELEEGLRAHEAERAQALPLAEGRVLPPTGKTFEVRVATLARWEKGRIAEEHLFWDNAHLNRQIGLVMTP